MEKQPGGLNSLFFVSLASGGVAGLVTDIALFPIDTLKTRLQSERGFWRSGGFTKIYRGLGPAAAGSAPTAALFFCSYELCKSFMRLHTSPKYEVFVHMTAASVSEVVACVIRVPVEIAKQRRQALIQKASAVAILVDAYRKDGFRRGLYRGFGAVIIREIPFSFIQFPLWEYLKANWTYVTDTPLGPFPVAICGAIAGGIAAAVTTPLDVAKTRIMLTESQEGRLLSVRSVLSSVYHEKRLKGIFAGLVPRVMWITMGGAIFFGFYDLTTRLLGHRIEDKI